MCASVRLSLKLLSVPTYPRAYHPFPGNAVSRPCSVYVWVAMHRMGDHPLPVWCDALIHLWLGCLSHGDYVT